MAINNPFKSLEEARQQYLAQLQGSGNVLAQGQAAAQQIAALQAQAQAQAQQVAAAQKEARRRQFELQKEQYKAYLQMLKDQQKVQNDLLKERAKQAYKRAFAGAAPGDPGGVGGTGAQPMDTQNLYAGIPGLPQQPPAQEQYAQQFRVMQARNEALAPAGSDAQQIAGTPTADYVAIRHLLKKRQGIMDAVAAGQMDANAATLALGETDQTIAALDQGLQAAGLKSYTQLDPNERATLESVGNAIEQNPVTGAFKNIASTAVSGLAGLGQLVTRAGEGLVNSIAGTDFTGATRFVQGLGQAAQDAIGSGDSLDQLLFKQQAQQIINDTSLPLSEQAAQLGALAVSHPTAAAATTAESLAGTLAGGGLGGFGLKAGGRVLGGLASKATGGLAGKAASRTAAGLISLGQRAAQTAQAVAPRATGVVANAAERVGGKANIASALGATGQSYDQAARQILNAPGLTDQQRADALNQAALYSGALGAATAATPALLPTVEASVAKPVTGGLVRRGLSALRPAPGEAVQEFAQGAADQLNAPLAIANATGQQLSDAQKQQALAQGLFEGMLGAGAGVGRGAFDAAIAGRAASSSSPPHGSVPQDTPTPAPASPTTPQDTPTPAPPPPAAPQNTINDLVNQQQVNPLATPAAPVFVPNAAPVGDTGGIPGAPVTAPVQPDITQLSPQAIEAAAQFTGQPQGAAIQAPTAAPAPVQATPLQPAITQFSAQDINNAAQAAVGQPQVLVAQAAAQQAQAQDSNVLALPSPRDQAANPLAPAQPKQDVGAGRKDALAGAQKAKSVPDVVTTYEPGLAFDSFNEVMDAVGGVSGLVKAGAALGFGKLGARNNPARQLIKTLKTAKDPIDKAAALDDLLTLYRDKSIEQQASQGGDALAGKRKPRKRRGNKRRGNKK